MKKSTLSLQMPGRKIIMGLLLFFPVIVSSQNSVFPEKDAIWCIKTDFQPRMLLYGLIGDTIINEKHYSKLYLLNDTTLNIDENDEYIGAIRTEERKVWMYPRVCNVDEEFLLYDFTKNKGEQITDIGFMVEAWPVVPIFVVYAGLPPINILNITEDEFKRKHYILETAMDEDEWVEGLGSLKGLFLYYPMINTGQYTNGSTLVSLKQGDSIVYHNKEVCDQPFCWFGVGVEDTQQKQTVTLYPNPVKETLRIDLGEIPLPVRFELFDPQGRITYAQTLTNSHTTVTPPPHSKGLHHYRLTGSDGTPLQSGQLLNE
ncbi:MAG: T9SS type A sorting domain-containing protein [Bacteroidales bacterium]|nr:T9SS type A sorting domain-containing protein [Bacteroidales bacterium]